MSSVNSTAPESNGGDGPNMEERRRTLKSKKSGQEVAKHNSYSKTDARYWRARLFRNSYSRAGERAETINWCARLAHVGRREVVNLRTSNADAAAAKARDLYLAVLSKGWEAALAVHKPKAAKHGAGEAITLGHLFTAAGQRAVHVRPTTLRHYDGCLRQVAADIAKLKRTADRHDYVNGGSARWRATVDALPLDILTAEALRQWQTAYVKAAGSAPEAVRSAKTSANSIAGCAARMFTPTMLEHYRDAGLAITTNPLASLKPFKKQDSRYISRVDPAKVLVKAREDLMQGALEPPRRLFGITKSTAALAANDRPQAYRVILLGTMTGLRRSELDRLQWGHIDFNRQVLTVQSTADGTVKGAGSTRDVDLPADLLALMAEWKAGSRGLYVVESDTVAGPKSSHRSYRCARIFEKAAAWLRKRFLPGEHHPLHTLRKEYGSLIAESAGIHAAADLLGHRDIRTASEYYVVRKTRALTGLSVPLTPQTQKSSTSPIGTPHTPPKKRASSR